MSSRKKLNFHCPLIVLVFLECTLCLVGRERMGIFLSRKQLTKLCSFSCLLIEFIMFFLGEMYLGLCG
jgi:energy-converting hydrogenase Eha subunit C